MAIGNQYLLAVQTVYGSASMKCDQIFIELVKKQAQNVSLIDNRTQLRAIEEVLSAVLYPDLGAFNMGPQGFGNSCSRHPPTWISVLFVTSSRAICFTKCLLW
jgi:hypothetical protein